MTTPPLTAAAIVSGIAAAAAADTGAGAAEGALGAVRGAAARATRRTQALPLVVLGRMANSSRIAKGTMPRPQAARLKQTLLGTAQQRETHQ
jgi:hypothetical protein